MGTDVWINTLDTESYKDAQKLLEVEFLPIEIKLIPLISTILGILLSLIFFNNYVYIIYLLYKLFFYFKIFFIQKKKNNINNLNIKTFIQFISIFKFFFNAYYFNEIYNYFVYKNRNLGLNFFKNLDKGFIEWIGPMLIVNWIRKIQSIVSKKYTGLIDHYIFIMILGLFSIIVFIYFIDIWFYDLKVFSLILIILWLEVYYSKK